MQKLTKTGVVETDNWPILSQDDELNIDALASESGLVHLSQFIAHASTLAGHDNIGVWITSDDDIEMLAPHCKNLPAVAIHFPVFADGRGFSQARLIQRMGFKGELLAVGNFMQDQLFYLKRCGFDAFIVSDDADIASMRLSLNDFQHSYQASADEPKPIYRRRLAS